MLRKSENLSCQVSNLSKFMNMLSDFRMLSKLTLSCWKNPKTKNKLRKHTKTTLHPSPITNWTKQKNTKIRHFQYPNTPFQHLKRPSEDHALEQIPTKNNQNNTKRNPKRPQKSHYTTKTPYTHPPSRNAPTEIFQKIRIFNTQNAL